MKYYSEILKKTFDSEKSCLEAEAEHCKKVEEAEKKKKELTATRKDRAKEVENVYRQYKDLLHKFINDYGSFHMTLSDDDSIEDIFEFFRFL